MATARRGVREPRSSSSSRQHRGRGGTPPPENDEIATHEQSDDDSSQDDNTVVRRGGRGQGRGTTRSQSSPAKDQLDGTTRRHPHRSPTTLTGSPGSTHLTSSHTVCHTSRRHTTREDEEAGRDVKVQKPSTATTSTTSKHQHHHHPHQHYQGATPALLIFVCLLILAGIYSLHTALTRIDEEKARKEPKPIAEVYEDLRYELQSLNRDFSQPREVWLGLLGQLESVMVEEPPQPAVLLLVVPDDSRGAATCLAHHLAKAVQQAFDDPRFVMFDTRSSQHLGDAAALKLDLDYTLQGLAGSHAAVVHSIESLPGHAAMILHAYCDNENAPYKQAIIFLLADVPGTYEEVAYSRLDSLVDAHLMRVWGGDGGLREKDVSALISRTANAPLLIRPESVTRMMELCPV